MLPPTSSAVLGREVKDPMEELGRRREEYWVKGQGDNSKVDMDMPPESGIPMLDHRKVNIGLGKRRDGRTDPVEEKAGGLAMPR